MDLYRWLPPPLLCDAAPPPDGRLVLWLLLRGVLVRLALLCDDLSRTTGGATPTGCGRLPLEELVLG